MKITTHSATDLDILQTSSQEVQVGDMKRCWSIPPSGCYEWQKNGGVQWRCFLQIYSHIMSAHFLKFWPQVILGKVTSTKPGQVTLPSKTLVIAQRLQFLRDRCMHRCRQDFWVWGANFFRPNLRWNACFLGDIKSGKIKWKLGIYFFLVLKIKRGENFTGGPIFFRKRREDGFVRHFPKWEGLCCAMI